MSSLSSFHTTSPPPPDELQHRVSALEAHLDDLHEYTDELMTEALDTMALRREVVALHRRVDDVARYVVCFGIFSTLVVLHAYLAETAFFVLVFLVGLSCGRALVFAGK